MTNNNLNNSIDIYLQEIYKKLHISDKEKKAIELPFSDEDSIWA